MDELKNSLEDFIDYLDEIIENPDRLIKLQPSLPIYIKPGFTPANSTPEKESTIELIHLKNTLL